jgi:ribosomal-protein-alanine N-acetyltransferase
MKRLPFKDALISVLTTARLFLRHFHIFDAEAMMAVFGDREVMRFGDGVQTREWVQNWISTCLERYHQTWGFGPYAVIEQQRPELLGYSGLFYFPDIGGQPEVEIGYRLRRSAWGQGFATEAARAVRNYAFHPLGLQRLIALIDPSNTASTRVAEKIGMHYERDVMLPGYTHPDRLYAISRG